MGGEVGNTQHDPASHLIFANVQTRNQLVAIECFAAQEGVTLTL